MKKNTDEPKAAPKPKIEVKMVKHTFSVDESNDLGMQLARAHAQLVDIEAELEQVKATFKSRAAEQQAIISRVSSCRISGFEMRNARCRVAYRPKEGQKDYFLEFAENGAKPVLTEAMTPADMQANLLEEENQFEAKAEIMLWTSAADGPCVMTVGRLSAELLGKKTAMWFAALDVRIEGQALLEKLDDGQPCATKRIDAIRRAAKRCKAWLIGAVGKDSAKGFDDMIDKAVEEQKEREE